MLNQNKNSAGATLLPDSVIKLAELLVGTGTTRFLNAEQLLELLAVYPKDDIPPDFLKAMMAKVSNGLFDESPVKKNTTSIKSRLAASSAKSRQQVEKLESDGSGTDSDQEAHNSPSGTGKVVRTKAPEDQEFKDLMSQLMSTSTRPTEKDKAREEEHLQKYKDFLPKMDKSHIVALVMNLVDPKAAADDQGRAISSIFQAIDANTQSLIELPMTSDTFSQNELKSAQASIAGIIALACLIKQTFGRENSSIKKQSQVIRALAKKYP